MTSTHIHTESLRAQTKREFAERGVTPDYDAIRANAWAQAYTCSYCLKPVHPDNREKHNALYHKDVLPTKSQMFAIGDEVRINLNGKIPSGRYPIIAVEAIGAKTRYIVELMPNMPYGVSESVLVELNYTPMYDAPIEIEASRDATPIEVVETVEPAEESQNTTGQAPVSKVEHSEYEATLELMELSLREYIEAGLCGDFNAAQEYMKDFQAYRFEATKQNPLQRIELTNTVVQRVVKSEPVFPTDYELLCIGSSKDIRRGVIEPSKARPLAEVLKMLPAALVGDVDAPEQKTEAA